VPRPAAERVGSFVRTRSGQDVTHAFQEGARQALELCRRYRIRYAILKQGSPSCGNSRIYDGTFSNIRIAGQGVAAEYLMHHGVQVFNEAEVVALQPLLGT